MARDIFGEGTELPAIEDVPRSSPIPPRGGDYAQVRNANLAKPGSPGVPVDMDMMRDAMALNPKPVQAEHSWSGAGKAVAAGAAGLGAQVAGAAEYGAGRAFGQNDFVTQGLHAVRQGAQNFAQTELQKMTPEEQDEMARQWTTLDPHQTIWQGGPSQLIHSVVLQASQAAPATIATIWPMGRMVRAGMTNGALAYVGATQAGLSMGQIANNISDDIMKADENTLRQNSPRYQAMVQQGMDPTQARQQLVQEAQKYAPVVGGLVSGAISTVAGRFLTPVLSKEGASFGARLAGGALDQAIQGGGTAGADYVARETAAHTYDNTRAPDFMGGAAATAEGAVSGALTGAAFAAASGHGRRPAQEPLPNQQNPGESHSTMEGTPENKATGAATESHTSMAGQDDYMPVDRGQHFEPTGEAPRILTPGQQEMDLPQAISGVDPAMQAAIQARHTDVSHWGEQQNGSGYTGAPPPEPQPQEPPWAGPMAVAQRQEQLPLQGGQMNPPRPGPTPPVPAPAQLNLPLRQRQRGGAEMPPVAEAPRTRADDLRARAAAQTTPDENQPDLFRDQPVPGQLTTRGNRPMLAGSPDSPSAEPFGDIQAQLRDLRDPNHERGGVYLSADNIASLRQRGLLDHVRQEAGDQAVPLVNFDEKGGTLIAKSPEHADLFTHYRDQKVGNMQEVLGEATGAGVGKPETGNFVVQQHDDQGNVTRETGVATQEEAQQLAQQYTDTARGRTAQVSTAPAAILRRAHLIALENEHLQRAQSEKGANRAVSDAVESHLPADQSLAGRAVGATRRDLASGEASLPQSREEAARRLTAEARAVHNEERARARRGVGALRPDDIAFPSERVEGEYRRIYGGLLDTNIRREMATDEATRQHAQAGIEAGERQLQSLSKAHQLEAKSDQLGRAALKVSPEGVEEYLNDKTAPGKQYVEPHAAFNPEVLEAGKRPSRADVHTMSELELQRVYSEVVERSTASPRSKLTREGIMTEDEGVRSKMEKRINRFFRTQEKTEELGHANSEKFAVSPRRALTVREEQVNRSKNPLQKRLVGYKTFDPEALMSTVESQREMERAATLTPEEARADRLTQWKNLSAAIERGEDHLTELQGLKRENLKSGDSPLLAQKYMRDLLQYSRALRSQNLRSPEARSAAKKAVTLLEALGKKEPAKRAQYLIDTYKTEMQRQARSSARANPEAVSRVERDIVNPPDQNLEKEPMSPYQLRHEAEVARRRLEDGLNPEIEPEPFAGRQAEHEGAIAQRQREDDEELRSSLGYPQKPTAFTGAARAIANHFENGPVRASVVIRETLRQFPEGSPMHRLFTALQHVTDSNSFVGYGENMPEHVMGTTKWAADAPNVHINRAALEGTRAGGQSPEFQLMHTLGHELTHIATSRAIDANPAVKARLEAILAQIRQRPEAELHYGTRTNNVHEMVAEAYSNREFQNFLDTVRVDNTQRSLWDHFKQIVADILGFKSSDKHYSALDAILREHGSIFRGKQYAGTKGELTRLHIQHLEKDADGAKVGNGFDRLMKSVHLDGQTMRNLATDTTHGLGQAGLSAMTPRQQSAQFSKYFERPDGTNPYKRYWDTFFKRAADNAISMEKVGKLSNKWSDLEERFGPQTSKDFSQLMHDATLYQFHPDLSIKDEANEHLTHPDQIARQKAGAAVYAKLDPALQAHYQDMKKYYANEQRNTTDQIVLNGLHAMLTKGEDAAMSPKDFDAKYDAEAVRRLGLDTHEGLQKEFGDKLSGASADMLAKIGTITKRPGPYFPLMRNGDFIVSSTRKVGTKEFDDREAAQKYLRDQRASDPTLSVSLSKTEDDTYRVSTAEKEVRMAESRSEANQHRREMAAQYGEENTSPVQLKADLYKGEGSITTGSALDNILRKLDDNPAAQTAIKDFYLRSLGDQSFRKRELTRSNRRGVEIENQHRSFAQYGRSQSYYLSQLKYGRHLANAQGEVQKAVSDHRDESEVSAVRMGEFAKELKLRDDISRNPYKVSELVKKGTSLTQFMMLTSPSHWFVRAAQPYVLSAPWLGARHGFADSVAALGRAQQMIAGPLLRETASSGLGLKALFSRAAAEKSYSVIDQVLQHVRHTAGADAKPIADMIQHLRDNNLIDLSMATELSDIGKGREPGLVQNVLNASRIMLHLAEVNNRVMTAIAARELGLKGGMTEAQAVDHAADAINVTHNDYSYGNTPRLFMAQSKGLLGGARPLMFQFMKYPQQVYGMMISSGLAALKGKSPQERAVGIKTLMGVLATHLVAAGAIGATIQPIKWAMGGLMAGASALGYTDQPYTVAGALSGDTYDHMLRGVMNELFGTETGELVSKGLPSALGVDLSQRMALASTYSFHLKTDSDASTIGSIAEAVGGPWLNVAENFADSIKKFTSGDVVGGIQGMSPHILRDLIKSGHMSQQGVVDNAGRTVIAADRLSAPELFAQSLGFRPEGIAETLDQHHAEQNQLQNLRDSQKSLIQKFASSEPSDRTGVREQVTQFNRSHPGFAISTSELLKAVAKRQTDELELQKYGVRARAKQLPEVMAAGAPYNVP